jgi:hypothetical protein
MTIFIFGNEDIPNDNVAVMLAKKIGNQLKDVTFITVKPNEDLPFTEGQDAVLMDVVIDLLEPTLIEDISNLSLPPRNSTHDFDLAFQLKYLRKIGKLESVKIIGLPYGKKLTKNDELQVIALIKTLMK